MDSGCLYCRRLNRGKNNRKALIGTLINGKTTSYHGDMLLLWVKAVSDWQNQWEISTKTGLKSHPAVPFGWNVHGLNKCLTSNATWQRNEGRDYNLLLGMEISYMYFWYWSDSK